MSCLLCGAHLTAGQLELELQLLSSFLPMPFCSSVLLTFPSPPLFLALLLTFLRTVYLFCFRGFSHSQNHISIPPLISEFFSSMFMVLCILVNTVEASGSIRSLTWRSHTYYVFPLFVSMSISSSISDVFTALSTCVFMCLGKILKGFISLLNSCYKFLWLSSVLTACWQFQQHSYVMGGLNHGGNQTSDLHWNSLTLCLT